MPINATDESESAVVRPTVERVTLLDGTAMPQDSVVVRPDTEANLGPSRPSDEHRAPVNFASFEEDFRDHYRTVSEQVPHRYEDLLPAYRHGYEVARAERFREREWDGAEPEVRREWESLAPEMPWPGVRPAVLGAWERVRGGL